MTAAIEPGRALPWPARFTTRPGADPAASLRQLDGLCRELWAVVRLLAAGTLDLPEFELKLASGEALFTLTEVAATVEERVVELGGRPDRSLPPELARRLAAALATPAGDRLPVLVRHWYEPLLAAFADAAFDPLLDGPSERVRRRGLADLRDAFAWFTTACGPAEPKAYPEPAEAEVRRPVMGARDERFRLFDHTRDYRKADDWETSGSAYQDDLVELLRINRDEIDALETFALALFDLVEEAPVEVLRHLARLAWDEARHAASGHALLAERGEDPYRFECSMIGIKVRGAMPGWDAWTQITLFGELGIIGPMRSLEREARRRGDERTAAAFAFICRDETLHLKESRSLLDRHHPAGGLAAAGEAARKRAGKLLEEYGLLTEEQYAALDERQIFELLGE
ncbi:hypothetical protein GCM10010193_29200 [Kitasatospora atroaurantiaca]|uniref:Uncharacterized protein n=1 Tax=Kitasatospora atroaurantiaca TaxID=285545 RepID=A0A561EIU0_9ACTN|nr:hypothetical protein [Kitasatospora atroaurantiaca]TWE15528.1 hypothetical protein FB465_0428 [Kitasatospora atroaurantiaca]